MMPRFHPILQDKDGSQLIDHGGTLLDRHIGFTQDAVGLDRGQPFVPEMNREVEVLFENRNKLAHLLRLPAFRPAHAQRQPYHQFHHTVLADDLFQRGQVGAFILAANGDQALSGKPERVRNRQTNGPGTNVEGHDAP